MPTDDLLRVEQRGPVTLLQLNRPEKRNAINHELIVALGSFFSHPPEGSRVIVVHAAGEHFCAGLDLIEKISKADRTAFEVLRNSQRWHRAFEKIQFGEVPVISVLKGAVIGGGLELAASTHIRVAESSAFFQLPEAQRGIFVGGGATVRVARIIGAGRMVEMMLTGRIHDAKAGLELGLAHYVVPDGQGLDRAIEIAQGVARNGAAANFTVINTIERINDMSINDGLMTESFAAGMAHTAGEGSTRIASFFEARKVAKTDKPDE